MSLTFVIEKKLAGSLARAGTMKTPHGDIKTPAFIPVATKAAIKALTPEAASGLGAQAMLANTYHLYLQPGTEVVSGAGGLHRFMNWPGPMFTDSGGFQAFSLGVALGRKLSKLGAGDLTTLMVKKLPPKTLPAIIAEEGVTFFSHLDGSKHLLTPEKSITIQQALGADIIFAFDECTSPTASYDYQKEALERTYRWAERSLSSHARQSSGQNLFGVVQGGRYQDLRELSARQIASLDFSGFGIGGSFDKEDIDTAVSWVNKILPEEKPRHLLGIGEPEDIIGAVKNGVDTFDCVAPTRLARNGTLYTDTGKINIFNAKHRRDFSPVGDDCGCYTCRGYTKAYLAHLFRAGEILAATLATVHNLYFLVNLVNKTRLAILGGSFPDFASRFIEDYQKNR